MKREDLTDQQVISIEDHWRTSNSYYGSKAAMIAAATPIIGCDGAVAVDWCGMILCIERDGHTHT